MKKKNLLNNPSLQAQYALAGVPRHCWHMDSIMPSDLIAKGRKPEDDLDAVMQPAINRLHHLLDDCKELRR